MAAGAFAGIAEHCASKWFPNYERPIPYGILSSSEGARVLTCYSVPYRCHQGEQALRPYHADLSYRPL